MEYGKFADTAQLKRAYELLEKKFTKKCQELAEAKKAVEKLNEKETQAFSDGGACGEKTKGNKIEKNIEPQAEGENFAAENDGFQNAAARENRTSAELRLREGVFSDKNWERGAAGDFPDEKAAESLNTENAKFQKIVTGVTSLRNAGAFFGEYGGSKRLPESERSVIVNNEKKSEEKMSAEFHDAGGAERVTAIENSFFSEGESGRKTVNSNEAEEKSFVTCAQKGTKKAVNADLINDENGETPLVLNEMGVTANLPKDGKGATTTEFCGNGGVGCEKENSRKFSVTKGTKRMEGMTAYGSLSDGEYGKTPRVLNETQGIQKNKGLVNKFRDIHETEDMNGAEKYDYPLPNWRLGKNEISNAVSGTGEFGGAASTERGNEEGQLTDFNGINARKQEKAEAEFGSGNAKERGARLGTSGAATIGNDCRSTPPNDGGKVRNPEMNFRGRGKDSALPAATDAKGLKEFVENNPLIADKIFEIYLMRQSERRAPVLLGGGGCMPAAPENKPKDIGEASKMSRNFFK